MTFEAAQQLCLELLEGLQVGRLDPQEFRDRYISFWMDYRDLRAERRDQVRAQQKTADQALREYLRQRLTTEEFLRDWPRRWGYATECVQWVNRLHSTVTQFTADAEEKSRDPLFFTVDLPELRGEVAHLLAWAKGPIPNAPQSWPPPSAHESRQE